MNQMPSATTKRLFVAVDPTPEILQWYCEKNGKYAERLRVPLRM
jgi:hypothetical protein